MYQLTSGTGCILKGNWQEHSGAQKLSSSTYAEDTTTLARTAHAIMGTRRRSLEYTTAVGRPFGAVVETTLTEVSRNHLGGSAPTHTITHAHPYTHRTPIHMHPPTQPHTHTCKMGCWQPMELNCQIYAKQEPQSLHMPHIHYTTYITQLNTSPKHVHKYQWLWQQFPLSIDLGGATWEQVRSAQSTTPSLCYPTKVMHTSPMKCRGSLWSMEHSHLPLFISLRMIQHKIHTNHSTGQIWNWYNPQWSCWYTVAMSHKVWDPIHRSGTPDPGYNRTVATLAKVTNSWAHGTLLILEAVHYVQFTLKMYFPLCHT